MPRHSLLFDLVDEPAAIAEYERWHRPGNVPGPVLASIPAAGIVEMEIHRLGNRLMMLCETTDAFDPAAKAAADAADPDAMAGKALMSQFQRPVPGAPAGKKWAAPQPIFRLTDHPGHTPA